MDTGTLILLIVLAATAAMSTVTVLYRRYVEPNPDMAMVVQSARHFAGDLIEGFLAAVDAPDLDPEHVVAYTMEKVGPLVENKEQRVLLEALIRSDVTRLLEYLTKATPSVGPDPQVTAELDELEDLTQKLGLDD